MRTLTVTYLVDNLEVVELVAAGQDDVSGVTHGVGQHLGQLLRDDAGVRDVGLRQSSVVGIVVVVVVFVHLQLCDVLQLFRGVELKVYVCVTRS